MIAVGLKAHRISGMIEEWPRLTLLMFHRYNKDIQVFFFIAVCGDVRLSAYEAD